MPFFSKNGPSQNDIPSIPLKPQNSTLEIMKGKPLIKLILSLADESCSKKT